MDAMEFLVNLGRYCKNKDCKECHLWMECDNIYDGMTQQQAEAMINFIDKWTKDHPAKTRQSEFLKMFPNAKLNPNGVLCIPPCEINKHFDENKSCDETRCNNCCRDYWLQEVE